MYRTAIEKMKQWKESKFRKPLIIEGARQVGKTWLMKEFGKEFYRKTVYINFDDNRIIRELFTATQDTEKIIMGLEIYADTTISPEDTLIIFDEIQEVPEALKSLKYFCENAPQYHIVCAGSLLGIALHNGTSFPVGKVDFLRLYPLSFEEFLLGTGNERLYHLLQSRNYELIGSFAEQFIERPLRIRLEIQDRFQRRLTKPVLFRYPDLVGQEVRQIAVYQIAVMGIDDKLSTVFVCRS